MVQVGYLLNKAGGLEGEQGKFFDYITAKNGIFIHGSNAHLDATIKISNADIRGLEPLEQKVVMYHGKVSREIYTTVIPLLFTSEKENYVAITWNFTNNRYELVIPKQESSLTSVIYTPVPSTVIDLHSHGKMRAFFSSTDDEDDQGLRIYAVFGKLHGLLPQMQIRIGVYGYFSPMDIEEVFDV